MLSVNPNLTDANILARVLSALDNVKDPEIPAVSIRELGMVHDVHVASGYVRVELLPTFVGCPALEIIRNRVRRPLETLEGVAELDIAFVMSIPWSSDRITGAGIEKLRSFGIAAPAKMESTRSIPPCPYCGQEDTNLENLFGPTACRAIFYCRTCQQPFEGMKRM